MQNRNDILVQLRKELESWFVYQCKNPYTDYYLYHRPSSHETRGDIIIAENAPTGYELSWNQPIRKDMTIDNNMIWIDRHIVGGLPVLDA